MFFSVINKEEIKIRVPVGEMRRALIALLKCTRISGQSIRGYGLGGTIVSGDAD